MIDKQKLLQWIADKRYVYEGPYEEDDTTFDIERYSGSLTILSMLQTMVDKGWLDYEQHNEEEGKLKIAVEALKECYGQCMLQSSGYARDVCEITTDALKQIGEPTGKGDERNG